MRSVSLDSVRITLRSASTSASFSCGFWIMSARMSRALPTSLLSTCAYTVCSREVKALRCPPMFSKATSMSRRPWRCVPLKKRCSRKWAAPLLFSFSKRLPQSMYRPTVEVSEFPSSVATRSPLVSLVIWVAGVFGWLADDISLAIFGTMARVPRKMEA
eukprot:33112_6